MGQIQDVQTFVREANRITEIEELEPILANIMQSLGFDLYALVHHVPGSVVPENVVRLSNYPEAWRDVMRARNYFADNPVIMACQKRSVGFIWSQLPSLINLTARQKESLAEWNRMGFGEGFTVPMHVPGEIMGSCSMSVGRGTSLPEASLPAAQYVACFTFEAARRIARDGLEKVSPSSNVRSLTQRQLDCVVLVGRGKSDWDISRLLGISDQTVHQHVEEAKRRYGVASRTQLVVRALYNSQLTFSDIIE
jgi:LuxR family quorum-sensing system transcriptional regulator CciR